MSEYIPIKRANLLKDLDKDETVEGYLDGYKGEPEPRGNRSLSYWHGWKNGAADGGYREIDFSQRELAHDYVESLK